MDIIKILPTQEIANRITDLKQLMFDGKLNSNQASVLRKLVKELQSRKKNK